MGFLPKMVFTFLTLCEIQKNQLKLSFLTSTIFLKMEHLAKRKALNNIIINSAL
jgi:hypothetical protein